MRRQHAVRMGGSDRGIDLADIPVTPAMVTLLSDRDGCSSRALGCVNGPGTLLRTRGALRRRSGHEPSGEKQGHDERCPGDEHRDARGLRD